MPRRNIPVVRYYLYSQRNASPIIAVIVWRGVTVRLTTGLSTTKQAWNRAKQRLKPSASMAGVINSRLDEIASSCYQQLHELYRRGVDITPEHCKYALERAIAGSYGGEVLQDLQRYMDLKKVECTEGTIATYRALHQLLEQFFAYRGMVGHYRLLTADFLCSLVEYMLHTKCYLNSQIAKLVKRLYTFLRYASQHGWGDAPLLQARLRLPAMHRIERAYLRLEELERFRTAHLEGNLAIARDMFVLQCYTGLRWSDLRRLNRAHYDAASDTVVMTTQKTRKTVRIPLLPIARQILERYDWNLPQWSNAYQNKLLKVALKVVGIDEPVVEVEYRGAERIERVVPKYEAISTHSAKRTFVSVLLSRGVTLETICKITGNTRATIEAYIQKDETDMKKELLRALETFDVEPQQV